MADIMGTMKTTTSPGPEITARKRMALEPHGHEILRLYHAGWSMQRIVDWLADPPRDVHVARSSVFRWVKGRLEKLKSRAAETGVNVDTLLQQMYGTTTEPTALSTDVLKTQPPKSPASTKTTKPEDNKPAPWDPGRTRINLDDCVSPEDPDNPFGS